MLRNHARDIKIDSQPDKDFPFSILGPGGTHLTFPHHNNAKGQGKEGERRYGDDHQNLMSPKARPTNHQYRKVGCIFLGICSSDLISGLRLVANNMAGGGGKSEGMEVFLWVRT